MTKDFIAIWFNSFGSSFARYNNKETAILECTKKAIVDWGSTFKIEGNPITVSVFDASGLKEIQWDHGTVYQPSFLKKLQFSVQNASVDYYKGKELDKQTKTLAV